MSSHCPACPQILVGVTIGVVLSYIFMPVGQTENEAFMQLTEGRKEKEVSPNHLTRYISHPDILPGGGTGENERLIVVNTMTYESIFRRGNLARTAAQLRTAGSNVLWVIVEDTHSLRKLAATPEHYKWILDDTEAYIKTLGVETKYIRDDSPFPKRASRSPVIESYQRNQALYYTYNLTENQTMATVHGFDLTGCGDMTFHESIRTRWAQGKPVTEDDVSKLKHCPIVYIADDDNVYLAQLFNELRKVVHVGLFPVGNMGYDGIEGPIVQPPDPDEAYLYGLGGKVVGFNIWHGSDPKFPTGWDKAGAPRKYKADMAGIAFNAVLAPKFTGPRYGYHETNIIEQTNVHHLEQIEGSMTVLAHHVHNIDHGRGRLCYPINWEYGEKDKGLWVNRVKKNTYGNRADACNGCAPDKDQKEFRGCSKDDQ